MSRQVYFVVVTSDFQNDENFDMGTVNADPNETIAALKEKVAAEIGFPKMKFKVYADKSTSLALNATVDKHGSDPANALMVQLIENRSTGTVLIHSQGLRISITQNMHCFYPYTWNFVLRRFSMNYPYRRIEGTHLSTMRGC